MIDRLPDNIRIQEILIRPEEEEDLLEEDEQSIQEAVNAGIYYALMILGLFVLVLLLAPFIHYSVLKSRFKSKRKPAGRVVAIYPLVQFIMNQMGNGRGAMTPMAYAENTVDPMLGTNFAELMKVYLKIKYSNEELTTDEEEIINDFYPSFEEKLSVVFPIGKRSLNFLKVNRWFYYLINLNIS